MYVQMTCSNIINLSALAVRGGMDHPVSLLLTILIYVNERRLIGQLAGRPVVSRDPRSPMSTFACERDSWVCGNESFRWQAGSPSLIRTKHEATTVVRRVSGRLLG